MLPYLAKLMKYISAMSDLSETPITLVFRTVDFDCVTDGKVVPLSLLDEALNEDMPRTELRELIHSMAIPLDREVGRNDVIQQILEIKLGPQYVVSRKQMTKRRGHKFNP